MTSWLIIDQDHLCYVINVNQITAIAAFKEQDYYKVIIWTVDKFTAKVKLKDKEQVTALLMSLESQIGYIYIKNGEVNPWNGILGESKLEEGEE
ncbi:TPA: hypothetical protein EYP13_00165 [Candidatus Micrarchaeota archaeon]|nr:hypothetical protein [Candidatus Micrarchaeota archaeon]